MDTAAALNEARLPDTAVISLIEDELVDRDSVVRYRHPREESETSWMYRTPSGGTVWYDPERETWYSNQSRRGAVLEQIRAPSLFEQVFDEEYTVSYEAVYTGRTSDVATVRDRLRERDDGAFIGYDVDGARYRVKSKRVMRTESFNPFTEDLPNDPVDAELADLLGHLRLSEETVTTPNGSEILSHEYPTLEGHR